MTKIRLLTLVLAALSGTAMAEVAQARHFSRAMMLINHSHVPVSAFYASNSGDDAWKEDLLDGARLRPNPNLPPAFCSEPQSAAKFA
jgi:hypothetical protein